MDSFKDQYSQDYQTKVNYDFESKKPNCP